MAPMHWQLDDRGAATEMFISFEEVKRRQWHSTKSHQVPPIWRAAVARAIGAEDQRQRRAALAERIAARSPAGSLHQIDRERFTRPQPDRG